MAERPILFNTEMVRAILDDRKTQTRRICKIRVNENEPVLHKHCISVEYPARNYMGVCANFLDKDGHFKGASQQRIFKDDILWVRETWRVWRAHRYEANADIKFKAGGDDIRVCFPNGGTDSIDRADFDRFVERWYPNNMWRPSIHMPREAARLFLRVTDVRIERLQHIAAADALAEGVKDPYDYQTPKWYEMHKDLLNCAERAAFAGFWETIVKQADLPCYGWDASPWVWVIEFERIDYKK